MDKIEMAELVGYYFGLQHAGNFRPTPMTVEGAYAVNALRDADCKNGRHRSKASAGDYRELAKECTRGERERDMTRILAEGEIVPLKSEEPGQLKRPWERWHFGPSRKDCIDG